MCRALWAVLFVALATSLPSADEGWLALDVRDPSPTAVVVQSVSLSDNGDAVAFTTAAPMVEGDRDDDDDVYVFDRRSDRLTLESGGVGQGSAHSPSLSRDGRMLAFVAHSASGDAIVVHDRSTGGLRAIAADGVGTDPFREPRRPQVSGDGRVVVFDAVVGGQAANEVFVVDLATGVRERISVPTEGSRRSDGASYMASISGDGRLVAFVSSADLACGASCRANAPGMRRSDVYVRDRVARTTRCASCGTNGTHSGAATAPAMSADGRFVAFTSKAALVEHDRNEAADVYVVDLRSGQSELVSRTREGRSGSDDSVRPSLSADGRYVAFQSLAGDLTCSDRKCASALADRNLVSDVYVLDRTSGSIHCVSHGPDGGAWWDPSGGAAMDPSGRVVAFLSRRPTDLSDRGNDFDLYMRVVGR
jgi:Tol biopolymer transport system component